jgi:hypothetical protein
VAKASPANLTPWPTFLVLKSGCSVCVSCHEPYKTASSDHSRIGAKYYYGGGTSCLIQQQQQQGSGDHFQTLTLQLEEKEDSKKVSTSLYPAVLSTHWRSMERKQGAGGREGDQSNFIDSG